MRRSKAPDFVERRNAATNAKKTALEKFRAHAGDPGLAERQTARVALAARRNPELWTDASTLISQELVVKFATCPSL